MLMKIQKIFVLDKEIIEKLENLPIEASNLMNELLKDYFKKRENGNYTINQSK